eukprot:7952937-Pyramimonas_sp.AAC.1
MGRGPVSRRPSFCKPGRCDIQGAEIQYWGTLSARGRSFFGCASDNVLVHQSFPIIGKPTESHTVRTPLLQELRQELREAGPAVATRASQEPRTGNPATGS